MLMAVMNSEKVVLDTFLLIGTENDGLNWIEHYDNLYPNQVERIVNATNKSILHPLPIEPNYWWDEIDDKFYPTKKPTIDHVWDMNESDWILPEVPSEQSTVDF